VSPRNERSTQLEYEGVTRWLIHHAARRAPESLSARLEEEWLADWESRSSALSRPRLALGCCWATVVINHDRTRIPVPRTLWWRRGDISLRVMKASATSPCAPVRYFWFWDFMLTSAMVAQRNVDSFLTGTCDATGIPNVIGVILH
jgi:hypothetical protein